MFITDKQILLQEVKSSQFEGVSGSVTFDPVTGTIMSAGLVIDVMNDVPVNDETFGVDARALATIRVAAANVTKLSSPFVFPGGSMEPR